MKCHVQFLAAMVVGLTAIVAMPGIHAAEPAASSPIEQLVRELDHDDYQIRDQASKLLATSGAPAVPYLVQGMVAGSPEVVWRGSQALQQIAIAGDEQAFQAVMKAIDGLNAQARPELKRVVENLRVRQQEFQHQRALDRLQAFGAKINSTETIASDGVFGPVVMFDPILLEADELVVEDFPFMAEAAAVAEVEWAHEPAEMTLEDRLALYEPIEVTFVQQFLAQGTKVLTPPAAILGFEDSSVEQFAGEEDAWAPDAEIVPIPLPDFEAAGIEVRPLEVAAAEVVVPAEGLLQRLTDLEQALAEPAPPVEAIAEAEFPAVDIAEIDGAEMLELDRVELVEGFALAAPDPFLPDLIAWGAEETDGSEELPRQAVEIGGQWKGGNDGVKQLQGLEGLVALTLKDAPLTSEALKFLEDMPGLVSLRIQGGELSAAELIRFHREHPDLPISARGHAWLGVHAGGTPCRIERLVSDGPAALAGLRMGDEILKVDGVELQDFNELTLALVSRKAGETVQITINRGDKSLQIPVKLQARQ